MGNESTGVESYFSIPDRRIFFLVVGEKEQLASGDCIYLTW